ncbi:DUF1778 domain-containing protein [Dactylosporangium roseum]|uniref:DUF1778 domain-containing protein n=1 Tax=Dactylosporangium roseum TaxID=47989 RepID=A0ABY5Z4F7_9ACTN|nr:DUF1778 domain-containing protein [Dactylosporangium roseum]UWZ35925.1 DUF1778 domain-containing protein [Dactylosporangium roseum]
MTIAASARFEFRLRPEAKRRIQQAADLVHESTSDFARTAAEERAERVLREHMMATAVPAEFFDELLAALDQPATPNQALQAAAQRARRIVERR